MEMHTTSLIKRIRTLCAPMTPQSTGIAEKIEHLKEIRAVLFDVYGTLFISGSGDVGVAKETANANALEQALANARFSCERGRTGNRGVELFLQHISETHARRRAEGIEYPEVEIRTIWKDVLSALAREGLVRGETAPEALERLTVEYEFRVNPVWPMPGLVETLQGLREKALLLGIVSNSQFFTPLLFHAFLGGAPEDVAFGCSLCVWSYEELEAKPSVGPFRRALGALEREHGVAAAETLYVGNDKLNDLWPADQVGCRTALFAGDRRSLRLRNDEPRCAAIRPDLIITDLPHLLDCLG